jgi:hypothetical protein
VYFSYSNVSIPQSFIDIFPSLLLQSQLSQLCLNVTFTAVPALSQCYIYSCPSSVSTLHLQLSKLFLNITFTAAPALSRYIYSCSSSVSLHLQLSQLCLNVTFPLLKCSHPLFLRLIN